jgi:hypothetical protein
VGQGNNGNVASFGAGGGAGGSPDVGSNIGGIGATPDTTILTGLLDTSIASTTYCAGGQGGYGSAGGVGPINSGYGGAGVTLLSLASGAGQTGIVVIAYKII